MGTKIGESDYGRHVYEFDWEATDSVTMAVVEAVAETKGVEETELERVTERVEPDALNRLFRPTDNNSFRSRGSVSFPFAGLDVTVYAHGEIVLTESD